MYPKHWLNVHQIKIHFTYNFPKTCPYSPNNINWTVPYWVLRKLKSRSYSHQITFLVNRTFSKIFHITPPSFPTIFTSSDRCLCFAVHLGHQKTLRVSLLSSPYNLNSYPNYKSARVSVRCWKTHDFPCFCVWWWIHILDK